MYGCRRECYIMFELSNSRFEIKIATLDDARAGEENSESQRSGASVNCHSWNRRHNTTELIRCSHQDQSHKLGS